MSRPTLEELAATSEEQRRNREEAFRIYMELIRGNLEATKPKGPLDDEESAKKYVVTCARIAKRVQSEFDSVMRDVHSDDGDAEKPKATVEKESK